MKPFFLRLSIAPVLLIGCWSVWVAAPARWRESAIPLDNFGPLFGCLLLIVLLLLCFLRDWKLFERTGRLFSFFPSVLCLLLATATAVRHLRHQAKWNEPVMFSGLTQQIGTDGMSALEFRKNGSLLLKIVYRFQVDHYSGTYQRSGDTFRLYLPNDLGIGAVAIRKGDSLYVAGSELRFSIYNASSYEN